MHQLYNQLKTELIPHQIKPIEEHQNNQSSTEESLIKNCL